MRFALRLYADATAAAATTPDQAMAEFARYDEITAELEERAMLVGGEAFLPIHDATEVRHANGNVDAARPQATNPELSGFYLLDCDRDEAVEIAARLPVATHGHVEVRPIMALPSA